MCLHLSNVKFKLFLSFFLVHFMHIFLFPSTPYTFELNYTLPSDQSTVKIDKIVLTVMISVDDT